MALGPKLVDDIFGPKRDTAKPIGVSVMDDLFGAKDVSDKSNFDLTSFGKPQKQAAETFARTVREADTAPRRQEARAREQAEKRAVAPIEADSELGRVGESFWRRVRGLGAGGGRLALTGLTEVGIDPDGEAAQWLRAKTQSAEEYSNRPIEGEQTWDGLKKNPTIGGLARFVLEQGASSAADMGLLATGAGLAPYIGLQAGSTGQQRAQNNGETDADAADVFAALPAAVGSAALERLGIHGIFGAGAKSVAGRIAQAFGAEALTEALQSPVEYAGSNLGTDAGFDWREAADQAAAGAIAGGFMGGAIRGAVETPGAVARRLRGQRVAPGVIEAAEATPAPVTEADAASPLPTDLIAEGKRVMGASTATTEANGILTQNGAPEVGTRVSITINGKQRTGTIRDAFVDQSDAELGAQPGVNIDLDGGGSMKEFFADLQDAGVSLTPVAGPTADEQAQAEADMRAGGLDPAATLEAIAQTGETPAAAEPAAAPVSQTPRKGKVSVTSYMARARQAESGGNDAAANSRSSASGRYQFTDSTFARYYEKVYGGTPPAGAKNDPEVQDRLMRAMTEENAAGLTRAGIPVDDASLYAAHHFGLGGALSMSRNPTAAVDRAIVKANPQFAGMTNAQAMEWTARHIGGQRGATAGTAADAAPPAPIEEAERSRLLDEPLSTAQVELPAAPAAADTSSAVEQEPAPVADATVEPAAPLAAPVADRTDPVVSPPAAAPVTMPTITETPSGKGIAVAGASEAQLAAIAQAVPKARAVVNKDGSQVYSAKYRGEIEAALSSVTPVSTPAAEQSPQQMAVSDTLSGGMPVEEAAAVARRADQMRKQGARVTEPVTSEAVDDATFKKVWKSTEFKRATSALGDLPHRESPVAQDLVNGWSVGKAGNVQAILDYEISDRHQSTVVKAREGGGSGWNPRLSYLEGAYAAVMGEAAEVRAVRPPNRDVMGAAEAIEQITNKLDPQGAPAAPNTPPPAGNLRERAERVGLTRTPVESTDAFVSRVEAAEQAPPAAKPRATRDTAPVDAVTFLARNGGIRDDEGHALKRRSRNQGAGSRDLSQFAPGGGHVFRKNGMTLDEAGELLAEAGYFQERPTTRQVIDMLDRSAFENQYRPADAADVADRKAARQDETDREGARVFAERGLEEYGITDATAEDIDGVAAYMADGRSSLEAVEDYFRGKAEARSEDFYEQTDDAAFDIPFDEDAPRSADFGNVEGFESSPPVASAAEGRGEAGRATQEDRPVQADAFGEREGDQRRALERQSEGRSRATVAQKAAGSDGGLFDNNAGQPDLMDTARADQRAKQGARDPAPQPAAPKTVEAKTLAEARTAINNGDRVHFDYDGQYGKTVWVEQTPRGWTVRTQDDGSPVSFALGGAGAGGGFGKAEAMQRAVEEMMTRFNPPAPAVVTPAPAPAAKPSLRRATDKKNPNPWVRGGERYVFTAPVGYLGREGASTTYEVDGRPGQRSAFFRNVETGGASSLNNYEIEQGLKSGTIVRVDAPAAQAQESAQQNVASGRGEGSAANASKGVAAGETATYGASNKLVTTDRAAILREKLRAKMGQINSGIDPEVLALGAELAVFHIEAGARKFADFSSRMVADIGESVRPYLRSFYESARYYPGMDAIARDMSSAAQIEEEGRGDQGAVSDRDAGSSAADVQPAAQERSDGRAPASEGEGSRSDVQGSERGRGDASERADEGRRAPEGDRAAGAVDADRVPARAADAGRGRRDGARDSAAERVTGENWRIEPGALDEARGAAQKARDNVRAIEIVRELDASGAPATREQQAALAKYVGWGGLKNAFSDTGSGYSKGFEKIGPRVRELLTDEEYDTARRSVQYAHYTSEQIIRPMWDAVRAMGFTGGKVFEPGMGTGNFLGMMPAEIAARSQYQGVEFDGITARIAQLLYPQSGIRQADFTQGVLPRDTYDLVIGNPPFSQTVVRSDPNYGNLGFVLHDFFFAKSLDAVRPGGLLMFVTSAGTMNKVSDKARAWMAERADLVGAVRLPGGAFRENAGTDVTTDIIVLKKREAGAAPGPRQWVGTTDVMLPTRSGGTAETAVNSYFVENPDQVLGEQGLFDLLTAGERYGVRLRDGQDMAKDLPAALQRVAERTQIAAWTGPATDFDTETTERKEGSFYVGSDGRLMQQRGGLGSPVEGRGKGVKGGIPAADQERIRALVPIRDSLRKVLSADLASNTAAATAARAELNSNYDRFVQQFGPINKAEIRYQRPSVIEQESARAQAREEARLAGGFFNEGSFTPEDPNAKLAEIAAARRAARETAAALGREWDEGDFDPAEMPDKVIVKRPNVDAFMDDQEGYRLRSIEHYNDDTGEAQKGAIFFRNVVSQETVPEIRSANDALLYVLNRTGRPDLSEIADRAGISRSQALEDLGNSVFRVPGQGETYQTREQYLSGNVRQKLDMARAEAARDPDLRRNVAALEAVQPALLGPSDISANLGMPWIPAPVIQQFAESLGLSNVNAVYRPKLAQWSVHGNAYGAAATTEWGTGRRNAIELLNDALNRQQTNIYDTYRDADGKEQRVINPVETQAAQDKVRDMRAKFSEWVWSDDKRAGELVGLYNESYNNLVAPTYDGSYLTTPGIAESWSWRPHQKRVVSRIIQAGNTYMAHAVGAGKTSAMIGAGMEMRRLGLVRKPMYAVPNHMLGQFTKEFYEQYPTAKIMVADERQFHTDRRKQFVANMATEDLDAVIITHSAFGFIPVSDAFADRLLKKQIDDFRGILNELKAEKSSDPSKRITVSRIEQQIESMTQKLSGRKKRADQVFTFEETGIDFLFVDEAHLFRKLDFATKMGSVRGVDPNGSAMSYDLFAKTRYLEEQNPGRSHVLASGTPVTNTMAELFSLQRYQQASELAERGLEQFDAWAGAFGETVTALEQDPAGGYKPQTRFAKFVNVPELSAMVRQVMDVVTSRQLEQYVVRPKLKGGSRQMIVAEPTPALQEYQQTLGARMKAIEARRGKPKKGDDILLSVIGDGRKAAIDMRLVNPALREDEQSKLEMLIDSVSRIAEETKAKPFYRAEAGGYASTPAFTGPATQMIFSDLGINGDFQIHRYIRQRLIAGGLKDSEVAIISDYKTSVARQRLFNDMNEGKVRVLIGSVPKMGTGVNAQRRLYAIHNLDPQWYPANDEQRNGRGLRQGNMNPEIEIRDYSTKGTYDSTMWQMMETKARFIDGFFNGDPSLRSMDDLGEASQYEQAKALTTADPRILELTQYRQDLERAQLRKAGFERSVFAAAERVRLAEETIERQNAAIPEIEKDIAQRQDISGDNFKATVGGTEYTVRAEFGQAILDRMEEMAAKKTTVRDRKIAEISGFPLTVDVAVYGKDTSVTLYLNRNGEQQQRIRAETPDGIPQSAAAVLRGFESDLADARGKIERAKTDIAEYTPQTKKAFAGQAEIDELAGNVNRIESQLTAEASAKNAPLPPLPDGAKLSVTDEAAGEGADMDAVRAKLAAEAKRMGISGDRLVISTVNTLLNDNRVAGMYFNGVISVALDNGADPTATFHHEFVHALRDMGLFRGAEWVTLEKAARADAKIMARVKERYGSLDEAGQTEEAVAIMFAQWQGNRTGFMGAALGRIRDFIAAIRQLVTRTQTAGDIMRQIDRGAIGAREGEAAGGAPRESIMGDAAAPNPATVSEATEAAKTLVGRLGEGVDAWRVRLQDRMLPALRAEAAVERVIGRELRDDERPYLAEELMTGRVGAKMERLTDAHVDPLFAAMEAEGVSADELESFLYAKHAPERNAHVASINPDFADGSGSGMSDIEAAAILARIDRAGRTNAFERVADRVYGMLEFARNERREAGLLSEEQADSWDSAYEFYVPLRGFAELDNANERGSTGGMGLTVRGAESKRAFGRRSMADDIIAHSIMQAEEAIVRGEKNKVARAFYDLAKASPDPDFWTVNKVTMKRQMNPLTGFVESYPVRALVGEDADWTVSLKIEGKEARVTMNKANPAARRLAEAMRRLDEQKTSQALVFLGKWNRFLSSVNTSLNPEFIITNAFRDVQTAGVNLAGIDVPGLQRGTLKDWRAAMAAATRGAFGNETGEWGRWWREFTDEGGRVSYNQMQDLETLRKEMERRFDPKRRPNPTGLNTAPKQLAMIAMSDIKAAYGFIDKLNTGVENAIRLSAYKNARQAGVSAPQAASIAKNLTVNFNRRGQYGVLMNALYLFYNASIQGTARMMVALGNRRVQKVVGAIVVAGALQELLNTMLSPDDDDGEPVYEKLGEFEKSRNMILMVKGPWGEYLKLPMPWGYNAFHTLGRSIVRGAKGDRPMTVATDALMAFFEAFNPIGSGSLLNMISPTFADPVVDLTLNKDYAGRPIMPNDTPFGPKEPDNQRYWNNVNPVWKGVTDLLNVGTGGDEVVAGAVDVSPETLEYLFGMVTGGAGAFVDRTLAAPLKLADGDPETVLGVNDIPLARKVIGKKPAWYDKSAFYARLEEVEGVVDNAKSYAQRSGVAAARAYIAEEKPTVGLIGAAKAARKTMSEVRKARNGLELARDQKKIDAATYAERMAKVTDAEKRTITAFNSVYIKAIKQPLRP